MKISQYQTQDKRVTFSILRNNNKYVKFTVPNSYADTKAPQNTPEQVVEILNKIKDEVSTNE